MSIWYSTVKMYFDEGYYTTNDVKVFVSAKWITAEEYQQITNEPYTV
ncbi:XkdX family protein [Aneurinibacillus thermoaerophilus]|nr:XkdX family protein [Aneurinibacillus thermoaerophilus]